MAQTDFLTGLLSKEAIESTLDKVKAECDIEKKPFSLLVLDLDNFKTYNDKYGHLDGDDILRYFSGMLRMILEESQQLIFRFGGDEFIVVFPGKTAKEAYHKTRDVINIIKKRPFLSKGRTYKLKFSAGISSYPSDARDIEALIEKADKAMYFSKEHGRGTVTVFSGILRRAIQKVTVIILFIVLAAGLTWYFNQSTYKIHALNWLKEKAGNMHVTLVLPNARTDANDPDIVHLKSGRVLRGTIIRKNNSEIELNLSLEQGRGTITLKNSEIERLEKRLKN